MIRFRCLCCRHSARAKSVKDFDGLCPRHGDSMLPVADPNAPKGRPVGRHDRDETRAWGAGRVIFQLPAGHPDRIVTSERQAMQVAKKHGLDFGTGRFKDQAAERRAMGTRRERLRMLKDRPSVDLDTFGRPVRGR